MEVEVPEVGGESGQLNVIESEMREGAHVRPVSPVSFIMNSLIVRRTIVARIIITVLTVFSVLAMFQVFC